MNQMPTQAQTNPPVELSDAMLQRAQEGLMAATSSPVQQSIAEALARLTQLVGGQGEIPINGQVRRTVLRALIHSCFRVQVEKGDRLPRGPAILCANHLNHIDPFLILAAIPAQPYCYILGDARTLYNKFWKRLILRTSGGVIPLPRRWREEQAVIDSAQAGRSHLQPLAEALEQHVPTQPDFAELRLIERAIKTLLQQEMGLLLFPEGRLGRQEGQLQLPFKRGAATYALRSGLPLVPMALIGTQDLYWRKTLTIRFGEPLAVVQCQRPKRDIIDATLVRLQQAIAQLLPTDYQDPTRHKPLNDFLNHLFE